MRHLNAATDGCTPTTSFPIQSKKKLKKLSTKKLSTKKLKKLCKKAASKKACKQVGACKWKKATCKAK